MASELGVSGHVLSNLPVGLCLVGECLGILLCATQI